MSHVIYDDDRYHYSDHSHRWIAPPGVDQKAREAEVRAHMDHHRQYLGGNPSSADRVARRSIG
jgi:hypothetical protein